MAIQIMILRKIKKITVNIKILMMKCLAAMTVMMAPVQHLLCIHNHVHL